MSFTGGAARFFSAVANFFSPDENPQLLRATCENTFVATNSSAKDGVLLPEPMRARARVRRTRFAGPELVQAIGRKSEWTSKPETLEPGPHTRASDELR